MPAPPSHTGPVLLSDYSGHSTPRILRQEPLTVGYENGSGFSGSIDYLIEARDIYSFTQFAAGNPYTVGSAVRYIPLSHPDATALLCMGVRARAIGSYTAVDVPNGKTEALSNWSMARASLLFRSVPYAVDGSTPFMTIETRAASEVYTLAGSKLTFPSDSKRVDADAGYTVPVIVYTVTIYQAFALDDSTLNPLLGCVNNATFLGLATGTVRFDGYNSVLATTQGGATSYTRTLLLSFRPVPWNQFLRPEGTWEAVQKPDTSPVYPPASLAPLTA